MGGAHFDHWEAALDELEVTVAVVERMLEGEAAEDVELPEWHPPRVGPIPPEHVERARDLLERQRRLVGRTTASAVAVRQRVELVDKLTGSRQRSNAAVYVDVSA